MEKQQTEFADSPMLKFSTFSAVLRQWCFRKVSEPEVHRCGEFGRLLVIHELPNSGVSWWSSDAELPNIETPLLAHFKFNDKGTLYNGYGWG